MLQGRKELGIPKETLKSNHLGRRDVWLLFGVRRKEFMNMPGQAPRTVLSGARGQSSLLQPLPEVLHPDHLHPTSYVIKLATDFPTDGM